MKKVTFKIGKAKNTLDVHVVNGMGCVDCHKAKDVHGGGTSYRTMRDEGAVKARKKRRFNIPAMQNHSPKNK